MRPISSLGDGLRDLVGCRCICVVGYRGTIALEVHGVRDHSGHTAQTAPDGALADLSSHPEPLQHHFLLNPAWRNRFGENPGNG